ncbi:SA1320 family protein [Heyndrickxia sporothermodurans]
MVNTTAQNSKKTSGSNDKDLVELAGYNAYIVYYEDQMIKVNGNKYKVMNTKYKDPTGLDAFTVKNTDTNEYTIVYVGTNIDAENGKMDLLTDIQLLSKLTPAQITAARKYFNDMNDKYSKDGMKITSICGNSLGGGLVNAVAIEHPDVKAVTLNPALLPEGMLDSSKEYPNITNYFSQYDVLTKTETALGLDKRIPGKHYEINNGIPDFSKLGTNHTGYLRNPDESQYYTIGVEGEPGFGRIYIDADEHIVTSIWTGEPLYSGDSIKIDINEENLNLLANGLKDSVLDRLSLVQEYLGHSREIVDDEGRKMSERISQVQSTFEEEFENAAENHLFKGITKTMNLMKFELEQVISLLDFAEMKSKSLNLILNSPPMELAEHILNIDLSVESIFEEARQLLRKLQRQFDQLTHLANYFMIDFIPDLFKGGTNKFLDAVVGELQAHYEIIYNNKDKVYKHISEFQKQVQDTAITFQERDESLANAIANQTPIQDTGSVQKTNEYLLEESPYLKEKMRIKEIQLDFAFGLFTAETHKLVFPLLNGLRFLLSTIENTLELLSITIKGVTNVMLNGTIPGLLISIFTNYDDKIRAAVNTTLGPIDEIAKTIEGVRKGINKLIINYPILLKNFKPYLYSALFSNSKYYNVHLYNSATLAILNEMELLFKDIVHQLSNHKAKAIDALGKVSEKVLKNIKQLELQIARGTMA